MTIREVAVELDITEQEVIDLAEEGKIPAYKIGGAYLRFKPEHIQEAKRMIPGLQHRKIKVGLVERITDFFYFNDFYILSVLLIILMLLIIFKP